MGADQTVWMHMLVCAIVSACNKNRFIHNWAKFLTEVKSSVEINKLSFLLRLLKNCYFICLMFVYVCLCVCL